MKPNQWKQRDRGENQFLIAKERGVGGVRRK